MTGARLRSTRSAWPCAGHGLSHSPQKGAALVTVPRVGDPRPLSQSRSCEHRRQAERAGQRPEVTGIVTRQGRNGVTGSEASRARPEGVTQPRITLELTKQEARQLQKSLERQLKAIQSSLSFWKHETANYGTQPPFYMAGKLYEADLIKRLYLELFDANKAMKLNETAYKTAKDSEQ